MDTIDISDSRANFAHNVAWLRKKNGLSKKEMARLLKIGLWSLNKLESGILPPKMSFEVVYRIYDNFGITPEAMIAKRLDSGNY